MDAGTRSLDDKDHSRLQAGAYSFSQYYPYVAYVAGALLAVFILCCLFCKCFRDGCWHFICCCCCPCCASDREPEPSASEYEYVDEDDSEETRPNYHPPPPALPPPPPALPPVPPLLPPGSAHSNAPRNQASPIRPQRLNNNYRRSMPPATYGPPGSAPPAAKQVARTAKIIGNILAYDRGKRKR